MKAYEVTTRCGDRCSDVVWAESASKARAKAVSCECCEDEPFTEIRVKRLQILDDMEEECATEGAWYTDAIRLILVKNYNWSCVEPWWNDCDKCCAKQYCLFFDD